MLDFVATASVILNFVLILYLIRMRGRHYILAKRIDKMAIHWDLHFDDYHRKMQRRHKKILQQITQYEKTRHDNSGISES